MYEVNEFEIEVSKPIRPTAFTNEKRDCTVRALSLAANIPYKIVYNAWKEVGRQKNRGVECKKYLQQVAKILQITLKQVKRHGSVKRLLLQFPTGNMFVTQRGHAFAVINGVAHDLIGTEKVHVNGAWKIEV